MKLFNWNAAAVLALSLFVAIVSAPAEARGGHHGWSGHRARVHHHAVRHRHGFRHHFARHRVARSHRFGHTRHASGGNASWYGSELAGHRTANGERFNPGALTAAHRSLPFGTHVRVTNNSTGRSVVVRINDRGPFVGGRSIDLAHGAARAIGMSGTSYVSMTVLR